MLLIPPGSADRQYDHLYTHALDIALRKEITDENLPQSLREGLGSAYLDALTSANSLYENLRANGKLGAGERLDNFKTVLTTRANNLFEISKHDITEACHSRCRERAVRRVCDIYGRDRVQGYEHHRLPQAAKDWIQKEIEDLTEDLKDECQKTMTWKTFATDDMRRSREACAELIDDVETRLAVTATVRAVEKRAVLYASRAGKTRLIRLAEQAFDELQQVLTAIETMTTPQLNADTYDTYNDSTIQALVDAVKNHPLYDDGFTNLTKSNSVEYKKKFVEALKKHREAVEALKTNKKRLVVRLKKDVEKLVRKAQKEEQKRDTEFKSLPGAANKSTTLKSALQETKTDMQNTEVLKARTEKSEKRSAAFAKGTIKKLPKVDVDRITNSVVSDNKQSFVASVNEAKKANSYSGNALKFAEVATKVAADSETKATTQDDKKSAAAQALLAADATEKALESLQEFAFAVSDAAMARSAHTVAEDKVEKIRDKARATASAAATASATSAASAALAASTASATSTISYLISCASSTTP